MKNKIIKTAGIGISGFHAILGPAVICVLCLKEDDIDFSKDPEDLRYEIMQKADKLSLGLVHPSEIESNIAKTIEAWSENGNYLFIRFYDYPKHQTTHAAYILAKAKRKEVMEMIQKKYRMYGNIGSGYADDPYTNAFLKQYFEIHKHFPPEAAVYQSYFNEPITMEIKMLK